MRISTKGRYALRMLADLAINKDKGYISLKEIAQRQQISKKYLEQIVPLFNGSGVLEANRGFQGGYKLADSAENFTVGDILKITEGNFAPVPCASANQSSCPMSDSCTTQFVWEGLYKAIDNYLDSITLSDIADKQRRKSRRESENIVLL